MADFTLDCEQLEVKSALVKSIVKLAFTKADGTGRVLLGTLDPAVIGEENLPTINTTEETATTQPVFDTEINEWRAFRWERLNEVSYENHI